MPNGQMSVKVSSLPMLVLQKQGEVIGKGIPTYVMARVNNRFIQTPKFTCTQNNIYEGLLKGDCGLSTPISGNYHVVITSFEKNEQPVCDDGSAMVYSSGKDWGDSPTLREVELTKGKLDEGINWLKGESGAYATWKAKHGEIIKDDGILIAGMKEYLDALGDRIPIGLASSQVLSTFITDHDLLSSNNDQYTPQDLGTWSVPHLRQLIHLR